MAKYDERDDDDNDDLPRRKRASGGDGIDTVIPFRNGPALAAYYCGIFGLISCFVALGIFGVVPIILGIIGLRRASSDPDARGRVHAWVGIVLGVIEVLSCVGIVGFFAFGALMGPRR